MILQYEEIPIIQTFINLENIPRKVFNKADSKNQIVKSMRERRKPMEKYRK